MSTCKVTRWCVVLAGLLAASWVSPLHALVKPDWLYTVAVPVQAQSESERQRAAAVGLLEVLSRVTGLQSIPRGAQVRDAIDNPGRFYNQYVFARERDAQNRNQLLLQITYQSQAVLDLVRAARLPVWDARRPALLALLVVETADGERRLLSAGTDHPVAQALTQVAQARGLPLRLPGVKDVSSEAMFPARAIWNYDSAILRDVAAQYAPDAILIGRVQQRGRDLQGGANFFADWRYALSTLWKGEQGLSSPEVITDVDADVAWVDEAQLQLPGEVRGAQAAAAAPIHLLANQLAERYAVLSRDLQQHRLSIRGISDVEAYAGLLKFLAQLEFVDATRIEGVQGDRLEVTLVSRARTEQLLQLLTLGGQLGLPATSTGFIDTLARVEVAWRG